MATYEEIYGKRVKEFDSDPTLESSYEGQVWYDKSTGVLKSVIAVEAFSSAAPLATARSGAGFGTQTAGVVGLGGTPPGGNSNATEEYNGSGWSTGNNANTARRYLSGFGIETAGVACGGFITAASAATEEYDGSSWTSGNNLNTARYFLAGAGILTAGVAFGGNVTPFTAATEEYDGTNWTNVNSMSTARGYLGGTGLQTAALACGGYTGSNTAATEEYDGTSWTAGGDLNSAKRNVSAGGIQTDGQAFGGGGPSSTTAFEKYDGTSWSTSPVTLATARQAAASLGQPGSQTANLITGGSGATSVTEEFNKSASTITAAAWAAGGSISTVRQNVGSTSEGSQTAAMVWGGRTGPPPSGPYTSNKSDTYDGTSFSTAPNLNTAARTRAGGGTTTAAWCAGGTQPAYINSTEEYDGSSWTSVTNAPVVFFAAGTGVQTAGLIVGVNSSSPPGSDAFPGTCLEYDGTNWATGGSPAADRTNSLGCSGTQTAGTMICGIPAGGSSRVKTIEEYDGSSFSTGGNALLALNDIMACCRGPQTATLITGGIESPSPGAGLTSCSNYDGTSTATTVNMGTGRRAHGSDGGQTSGLVMTGLSAGPPGNNNPNYTAAAEELTVETSAVTAATLTTS
jgi:hypothetical protein